MKIRLGKPALNNSKFTGGKLENLEGGFEVKNYVDEWSNSNFVT